MKRITTAVCAFALTLAWAAAPAFTQSTTSTDVKEKASDAVDKTKKKTSEAVDKTKEKTSGAVEKTKEKAAETKEKVRDKVTGGRGSDDIREAQQALKDKGFDPGPIDGRLGPQTKAALSEYQTKENLKVTGRLDSQTKKRLAGAPAASPATGRTPKN